MTIDRIFLNVSVSKTFCLMHSCVLRAIDVFHSSLQLLIINLVIILLFTLLFLLSASTKTFDTSCGRFVRSFRLSVCSRPRAADAFHTACRLSHIKMNISSVVSHFVFFVGLFSIKKKKINSVWIICWWRERGHGAESSTLNSTYRWTFEKAAELLSVVVHGCLWRSESCCR